MEVLLYIDYSVTLFVLEIRPQNLFDTLHSKSYLVTVYRRIVRRVYCIYYIYSNFMCAVKSLKKENNNPEEESSFKLPREELIPISDVLDQVIADLSADTARDCDNKPLTNAPTRESRAVEEENIGVIQFRIVFNDPDVTLAQEDVLRLVDVSYTLIHSQKRLLSY